MFGRKGQEEAPIELLIAVTVLTFVLIIGFFTYQNMCSSQFEQKMRASVSTFARQIEQVYRSGIGTAQPVELDFTPIGCPQSEVESVRLISGLDSEYEPICISYTGDKSCLILVVKIKDKTIGEEIFIMDPLKVPAETKVE